jgi:hypothetical protein
MNSHCDNLLKIIQGRQSHLETYTSYLKSNITSIEGVSHELRVSNYMKAIEMWTKLCGSTTTLEDALNSRTLERDRENI